MYSLNTYINIIELMKEKKIFEIKIKKKMRCRKNNLS